MDIQMTDNVQNEEEKKRKAEFPYRKVLAAAGIATGTIALIYLAGAFFFAGHYYWRTEIDGKDYSFCSRERVREEILNPSITYELQIKGREEIEDVIVPS